MCGSGCWFVDSFVMACRLLEVAGGSLLSFFCDLLAELFRDTILSGSGLLFRLLFTIVRPDFGWSVARFSCLVLSGVCVPLEIVSGFFS